MSDGLFIPAAYLAGCFLVSPIIVWLCYPRYRDDSRDRFTLTVLCAAWPLVVGLAACITPFYLATVFGIWLNKEFDNE